MKCMIYLTNCRRRRATGQTISGETRYVRPSHPSFDWVAWVYVATNDFFLVTYLSRHMITTRPCAYKFRRFLQSLLSISFFTPYTTSPSCQTKVASLSPIRQLLPSRYLHHLPWRPSHSLTTHLSARLREVYLRAHGRQDKGQSRLYRLETPA